MLMLKFLKTSKIKLKSKEYFNHYEHILLSTCFFFLTIFLFFPNNFSNRRTLFFKRVKLLKEKGNWDQYFKEFYHWLQDNSKLIIVLSTLRFLLHSLLTLAMNGSLKILELEGTLNVIKPKHPLSAPAIPSYSCRLKIE